MKIYVTGASGFIGAALVEHFVDAGRDVVSVARRPCPIFQIDDHRQVLTNRLFAAEWFDPAEADAVIIHCAGLSNPRTAFDSLNDLYESEIRLHISMVENLVAKGWQGRLIFLSSGGTVYGDVENQPIHEDVLPNPKTPYGLYKLYLEQAFSFIARHHNGIEAVSLRVSNPYGGFVRKAGQGVIPILIDTLRAGRTFQVFGDGSAQRDYIAMPDLCRAIESVIGMEPAGSSLTLNIGSGRGVALAELIEMIETASGRRLDVHHTPAGANVHSNVLCCKRAESYLHWRAEISIEDGIRALLDESGLLKQAR